MAVWLKVRVPATAPLVPSEFLRPRMVLNEGSESLEVFTVMVGKEVIHAVDGVGGLVEGRASSNAWRVFEDLTVRSSACLSGSREASYGFRASERQLIEEMPRRRLAGHRGSNNFGYDHSLPLYWPIVQDHTHAYPGGKRPFSALDETLVRFERVPLFSSRQFFNKLKRGQVSPYYGSNLYCSIHPIHGFSSFLL